VLGEHTAHDVSVDVDAERARDDAGDPWAAEPRIARLELDDSLDKRLARPLRAGPLGARARREQAAVLAAHQRGMKREERRRAYRDGELSNASWIEEERSESAEQPVAPRQVGRAPAGAPQDNQLLLEHKILGDHRADATRATQLRGHDRDVEHGDQEVPHARVSVGQTPSATQRCPIRESARELAIRDPPAPAT